MTQTIDLSGLLAWASAFRDVVGENREYLTGLDSEIGDADHGSNMTRGTIAAVEKLTEQPPSDVAAFGKTLGMTLVSTVGGASGPLFGTLFLRFGVTAGAVAELDAKAFTAAFAAGVEGVKARGKAVAGDKTMVDVLEPALAALQESAEAGKDLSEAAASAAAAAEAARDNTRDMVAKKGRASYLGARSAGHIDPGSASTAYLLRTLANTLAA